MYVIYFNLNPHGINQNKWFIITYDQTQPHKCILTVKT